MSVTLYGTAQNTGPASVQGLFLVIRHSDTRLLGTYEQTFRYL